MGDSIVKGIIETRWSKLGIDTVSLTSGQLHELERLKSRLRDAQRAKVDAAIERQSRG
jgi:hypothetical protein